MNTVFHNSCLLHQKNTQFVCTLTFGTNPNRVAPHFQGTVLIKCEEYLKLEVSNSTAQPYPK